MKIPGRPHCRQLKPHDHASSSRWNPACECRSRCWPCWGTFWEFACGMREKNQNEATRKLDTMSTPCLKFGINKYIKERIEKKTNLVFWMRSGSMSSAGRRSARKPMMVGLTKFHVADTSSWKMKRFTIRPMTLYIMKRWTQTMGSIVHFHEDFL
jgi:hypothetical protein